MDTWEMVLTLRKNGHAVPGLNPLTRRMSVQQSSQFDFTLLNGTNDLETLLGNMADITFLVLQGDQTQVYEPGFIVLNPGGLILLFNAVPEANVVSNGSGFDATNKAVVGGTGPLG